MMSRKQYELKALMLITVIFISAGCDRPSEQPKRQPRTVKTHAVRERPTVENPSSAAISQPALKPPSSKPATGGAETPAAKPVAEVSKSIASRPIIIAHFGDSTTITSYLPKDQRINAIVQKLLAKKYPRQKIHCVNAGLDGDYIKHFLDGGRYQKVRAKNPVIDVATIRYGQNDMKHESPDEFEKDLKHFIAVLKKDYPGVRIYLETGIYIDPTHWIDQYRKNPQPVTKYEKYWKITRKVAKELKLPLVDQALNWENETKKGNWDLRIRGNKDPRHRRHYYNAHPNAEGVKLYARELFNRLTRDYPKALPKAADWNR